MMLDHVTKTLSDKEDIRETILRWSRAVDMGDWDLLEQTWSEDLDSDFTAIGLPRCGAAELKALLMGSARYFDMYHHVISNLTFHDLTPDTARTSVAVTSWARPIDGEMFQVCGWYHDELRRSPAGWRISKRSIEVSFNTSHKAGVAPAVAIR